MPVADPIQPSRPSEERDKAAVERPVSQRQRETDVPEGKERPAAKLTAAEAVEPLQRAAQALGRRVDVQYRDDMNVVVMVVYRDDPETGEEKVVRQIPPEEALRLAQRLQEARSTILDEIA